MRVSVASGKGGTGKTLVATNLAAVADRALLVDLDVEEPNCHIFFTEPEAARREAYRPVPVVDSGRCSLCGVCGRVCEFHAIVVLPKQVMVFPELCHGCGACAMFCPENAISEQDHLIGHIVWKGDGQRRLVYGELRVGEASSVPLIRKVKSEMPDGAPAIIDCPPGTACPAVESMRGSDFCILVTEPTPFGLHDLKLALEVCDRLRLKRGVFINKQGIPGPDIRRFCEERGVPVLGELRFGKDIAERYSKGELLVDKPEHRQVFEELLGSVKEGLGLW